MLRDFDFEEQFQQLAQQGTEMERVCLAARKHFITTERNKAFIREWDVITFERVVNENEGRGTMECLHFHVSKLQDL